MDAAYPASEWGATYDVDGNYLHPMLGTPIEGADLPPLNGLTRPKLHEILTEPTKRSAPRSATTPRSRSCGRPRPG